PYTYDVNATGNPAPTYALTSAPSGMTIKASTGVISWTPAGPGSFGVTVRASNGVLPDATQSFTITVNANTAPAASITRPLDGEVVSGTTAEFFGDGADDARTVRAEFYVDGVLKYTDRTPGGHYHMNGGHNAWNTTKLSNGPHVLRMTVYDDSNLSGFDEVTALVSNGSGTGLFFVPDAAGTVVMESEHYAQKTPVGSHDWVMDLTAGYAGTAAMRALPDNGTAYPGLGGYAGASPVLEFLVKFSDPGTYYVWVRGMGPSGAGSDDTVHVGLDGAEVSTSDRMSGFSNAWTWSNQTLDGPVATIDVASAGLHTVDVWMSEDGFIIDRLLVTPDAAFVPVAMGPAESTRKGLGGGGGSSGGCGFTGLEPLLLLAALAACRAYRRT
ncbi:MAG TPA: putative Ig domain-containing protein, partial [Thermoplasmata archaeon]|nr:putative Ig domain-containing protein [Thermoplasmata archaeon]